MTLQPEGSMDVNVTVGEKAIRNILRNYLPFFRLMKVH